MLIDIQGFCPACGQDKLHIERYVGTVHCLNSECSDTGAAHKILAEHEIEHTLVVHPDTPTSGSGTWTLKHPLRERINDELMSCTVDKLVRQTFAFNYPPEAGTYRVAKGADGKYTMEAVTA